MTKRLLFHCLLRVMRLDKASLGDPYRGALSRSSGSFFPKGEEGRDSHPHNHRLQKEGVEFGKSPRLCAGGQMQFP